MYWALLSLFLLFAESKVLTVTPEGRWLTAATTVSFKSDLVNPTFRYTTHWQSLGTRPSKTTGTIWGGQPIAVNRNLIISVIAYNATVYDQYSFQVHTYLIMSEVVKGSEFTPAYRSLNLNPVWNSVAAVSITYPTTIPVISAASPTVPAQFEWMEPSNPGARRFYICGVKYSGNYNVYLEKKSYRLYFSTKDYGGDSKMKQDIFANYSGAKWPYMLPVDRFENFQLRSGSADSVVYLEWPGRGDSYPYSYAQYIRNQFGDELQMQLGHWSAHGRHVHLFDNGVYYGLYHIRERVDSNYLSDYVGGTPKDFEFINHCVLRDGNGTLWAKLTASQGRFTEFSKWANTENLADYMAIQQFNTNFDVWACWNWQGYGPYTGIIDGGFQFFGSDIDLSFVSEFGWKGEIYAEGPGDFWTTLWRERHPDFVMQWHDRLYKHFNDDGVLTPKNLIATWRGLQSHVRTAISGEVARWRQFTVGQRFTESRWEAGGNLVINDWLNGGRQNRYFQDLRNRGWMYLANAPSLVPLQGNMRPGQPVVLTNQWAQATLYYTKDGSDPRLPGGALNPNAINGGATFVSLSLTGTTTIIARSRAPNGNWSPKQHRTFYYPTTLAGHIQVTEVTYTRFEDFTYVEFIEIKNIGTTPVDLGGCWLDGDKVRFTWEHSTIIPPKGFLVGTNQRMQFRMIYGKQANFFYTGDFKKSTKFKIIDAFNNTVVHVAWEDKAPWPELALMGYSLVPSPSFNPAVSTKANNGKDWRFSKLKKGSPWADDALPLTLTSFDQGNDKLIVNEANLNPAKGLRWIEFRNIGTSALDINKWAFTDNIDKPAKYVVKTSTIIQPGQFFMLDEAKLGYSLKGTEDFYIINGKNDYHIEFPKKSLEDLTQGRYMTSDGVWHFTQLLSPTVGAQNVGPYLPPVVISGFGKGTPPFQNLQYIKLTSVSKNKDQDLTGWVLAVGDKDFKFKKMDIHSIILEPGQSVYMMNTTTKIADFKAAYGSQWLDPMALYLNVLKVPTFFDTIKLQKPEGKDEVTVDRLEAAQFKPLKKRDSQETEQQGIQVTRVLTPLGFSLDPKSWTSTPLPSTSPVACAWATWGLWGPCVCGEGVQSRTRVIQTPAKFGGAPCNDLDATQSQVCGTGPCDCSWGLWQAWGSCSKTCGAGVRTRTRPQTKETNGGKPCNIADGSVTAPCTMTSCPIDCSWESWSMWTECSASGSTGCGAGTQTRTRAQIPASFGGRACDSSEEVNQLATCDVPCVHVPVAPPIATNPEDTYAWTGSLSTIAIFAVLLSVLLVIIIAVVLLGIYSATATGSSDGGYQAY